METENRKGPPAWIQIILRKRLNETTLEEVLGDLEELYRQWIKTAGIKKARQRYILQALGYLRPLPRKMRKNKNALTQQKIIQPMIQRDILVNYFKTAWRSIIHSKGYSFLNTGGLALGMAVTLIIGLWVQYEYSYDKFLPGYQQLYQVRRNFDNNSEILTFSTTSLRLAEALRTEVPEIKYVAESNWMDERGLMAGGKKLYVKGAIIGGEFLKMFQYPLLYGTAGEVLKEPYSIVLTQSTAKALFGNDNPLQKTVRFDNTTDLKVTGILEDIPENSSLQFNFLVPFSFLDGTEPRMKEWRTGSFSYNSFQQFVKLREGVSYNQVAAKIKNIQRREKDNTNAVKSEVILQPLSDWHLYNEYKGGKAEGGFIEYVRLFSLIGLLVLLIACINFINLITARSEKRAREVGVRKVIGSRRKDLVLQFLIESFILCSISFLFSLLVVRFSLPLFSAMIGKTLSMPFGNPIFWCICLGCVVITTLLAGARPAFYLSSFQPVKVLKGTATLGKGAVLPRKILVVVQYTCSVALIIATIVIYQQIQFAKNRPTGFTLDRLLYTYVNKDLGEHYEELKNEALQQGIVESMATSSSSPTNINWHSDVDYWPGKNPGETIEMGTILTSNDYFKTIGFSLKEGRVFKGPADSLNVVFNETAIAMMRLKNPVGQAITWQDNKLHIIGIVKDALMTSPYAPTEPTMFVYTPGVPDVLLYRVAPNLATSDAIKKLTSLFNKYNPAFPYVYYFSDEAYARKFKLEQLVSKVSGLFAFLAIFISCLGLFGLAAYTAERRRKEIGVRKVLGASVSSITGMLSKDFLQLVFISCLLAFPLAFWWMNNWLGSYYYRVPLQWWVFALAGLLALLIALLTVCFQAMKAAMANPVQSLRTE